jgi:hypothetical protein
VQQSFRPTKVLKRRRKLKMCNNHSGMTRSSNYHEKSKCATTIQAWQDSQTAPRSSSMHRLNIKHVTDFCSENRFFFSFKLLFLQSRANVSWTGKRYGGRCIVDGRLNATERHAFCFHVTRLLKWGNQCKASEPHLATLVASSRAGLPKSTAWPRYNYRRCGLDMTS